MATVTMMAYPAREGFHGYSQPYTMYQTRPHHPQGDMAHAIHGYPYATYGPVPPSQPYHHHSSPRSPHSAASPGSDDGFKPSLPSISNLLGIADRPTSATAAQPGQSSAQQMHEQQQQQQQPQSQISPRSTLPTQMDQRGRTTYASHEISTSPRSGFPAPPPMRTDSVLESTQSPSAMSTASAPSGPPYFVGSSINNIEPSHQQNAQDAMAKRQSLPSQPNLSPYENARYTTSPYAASPGGAPAESYYSPTHPSYPAPNGLYQQRPLPSNFPPPAPVAVQSTNLPTSNPWEHHHYIGPSSQATFPQSQDRYICPTCNKAFSRPSSLKIHSHSHTGEKPFRCPHAGCGKAFSVRSNMKRHERGCHAAMAANPHPPPPPPHMQPPPPPPQHAHIHPQLHSRMM